MFRPLLRSPTQSASPQTLGIREGRLEDHTWVLGTACPHEALETDTDRSSEACSPVPHPPREPAPPAAGEQLGAAARTSEGNRETCESLPCKVPVAQQLLVPGSRRQLQPAARPPRVDSYAGGRRAVPLRTASVLQHSRWPQRIESSLMRARTLRATAHPDMRAHCAARRSPPQQKE